MLRQDKFQKIHQIKSHIVSSWATAAESFCWTASNFKCVFASDFILTYVTSAFSGQLELWPLLLCMSLQLLCHSLLLAFPCKPSLLLCASKEASSGQPLHDVARICFMPKPYFCKELSTWFLWRWYHVSIARQRCTYSWWVRWLCQAHCGLWHFWFHYGNTCSPQCELSASPCVPTLTLADSLYFGHPLALCFAWPRLDFRDPVAISTSARSVIVTDLVLFPRSEQPTRYIQGMLIYLLIGMRRCGCLTQTLCLLIQGWTSPGRLNRKDFTEGCLLRQAFYWRWPRCPS